MENDNIINGFIHTYFSENLCQVYQADDGVYEVNLTEKMDKQLMNRPFYWHYVKSTNQLGEPLSLRLITNKNKIDSKGEWLHYGSPRFQQMLKHLKQSSKHAIFYEELDTKEETALFPWLILNIKLIYKGVLTKEECFSLGLNLINGKMINNMMSELRAFTFQSKISDLCYSLTPIITLNSGYNRILNVFEQYINNQTHSWAVHAMEKYEEEMHFIRKYFLKESHTQDKKRIIDETRQRYQPSITINIINGGLFYLNQSFQK